MNITRDEWLGALAAAETPATQAAMSPLWRALISERTRAALAVRMATGKLAGCEPYGYRADRNSGDGKALQPYEPEQQILRVIADCREAGYSMRGTANELNSKGYKTRGGSPWHHENIRSILKTQRRRAA